MTKQDFIEMIENLPDDADLVVSNYTIGFVVTDVEYNELWNQIRLSGDMTNLDKIRTMPPEDLGAFLSNLVAIEDCFECPIRNVCNEAFHTCELSFYHWLQREYKPGYFENQ